MVLRRKASSLKGDSPASRADELARGQETSNSKRLYKKTGREGGGGGGGTEKKRNMKVAKSKN